MPAPRARSGRRFIALIASLVVAAGLTGCTHPHVAVVESFTAAKEAGDLDRARSSLADDPRVWWDERTGEGTPWTLGAEKWKTWDAHFRSESDRGPWQVERDAVWAIAEEMNDYFRLIERRDTPRYRITYFLDDDDRIAGYMISAADPDAPSPPRVDRSEEFEAWVVANEPEEWSYLRPGGRIDPTGDRAPRTRALLNRWRATVGLPRIE